MSDSEWDVAFWFMEDARYTAALARKIAEGVPVRVLVDPRANGTYPLNADRLDELRDAGAPMRRGTASGILHWKMMLFEGQNTVPFSAATYTSAFVPIVLYAAHASTIHGSWRVESDDAAAGGARLLDPDAGRAKVTQPLAAPTDYFELTFQAAAGTPITSGCAAAPTATSMATIRCTSSSPAPSPRAARRSSG